MGLQRRSDHAAKELRNIGGVLGTPEGHHGFGAGTIPAGRQIFLEEHNADAPILGNALRLHVMDGQPVQRQIAGLAKGMYDLVLRKAPARAGLDLGKAVIQIGIGNGLACATLHLDHEHGIDLGIMLLRAVLIPMEALILPFISRSLQHSHIVPARSILRVSDNDAVFQKARRAHLRRSDDGLMDRRCRPLDQCIEPLRRGGHADDHGDRRELIGRAALDKFLHDGRGASGILAVHPAVGLVNDEIQPVGFLPDSIGKRVPNGILPPVAVAGEIALLAQLLGVQKIDMPVIQVLLVEGFVVNGDALIEADFICFQINFLPGLRVQRRGV